MKFILSARYYILILLITTLSFGCSTYRTQEGEPEYILKSQSIHGNKHIETWEYEQYYKQKPNKKVLLFVPAYIPYDMGLRKKFLFFNMYNHVLIEKKIEKYKSELKSTLAEGKKDSVKTTKKFAKKISKKERKLSEGTWLTRSVGEPPAWFDTSSASSTINQFELYMQSNGYFNGDANYTIDTVRKFKEKSRKVGKVKLTFNIDEKQPYIIKSVEYLPQDTSLNAIINRYKKSSLLKVGKNYQVAKLSEERNMMSMYFRNHGYYDFKTQFIKFSIDSTVGNKQVAIKLIVSNPTNFKHKAYRIRKVYFTIKTGELPTDTIKSEGIHFVHSGFKFSKKQLIPYFLQKEGSTYCYKDVTMSQSMLTKLDVFKFVDYNFEKVGENELDLYYYASPFDKYQVSAEGGVSVNLQGQSIPGPFLNLSFKDRNVFNGFEVFEANFRYAFEGQASLTEDNNVITIREIGVNTNLIVPRMVIPGDIKYKFNDFSPRTSLTFGLSDIKRFEFNRTTVKGAVSYNWQSSKKHTWSIIPMDLNVIESKINSSSFLSYLDTLAASGNNLKQSFTPSIVSGMIFSFTYNDQFFEAKRNAWFNKISLESGGTTFTLYDAFANLNNNEVFNLPYYQYIRLTSDNRFIMPLGNDGSIVFRTNLGLSKPYGFSTVLPYEKFFFAGGSSSIRAWNPRRLGPGNYTPNTKDDGSFDYSFEQPGEIMLVGNFEIRKKLISYLHGAFFVDAGNVYTFTEDATRPGSQFKFGNLAQSLAVGTGVGLRFDFSFLILRFDLGAKLIDPARTQGSRLVPFGEKNQFVLNFGIGYPF